MNQRVLSAIMFTDIVGYSALASSDEEAALQLLEINEAHQRTIIARHGVYLKQMGDGILARFSSAYDSVKCAIDIQESAPEQLKGKIRIGIHLGDVSERDGDIFGDGVNIASRLESQAKPGSIYISESVYQSIKGRGDILASPVGDLKLKNIDDPVSTYAVKLSHSPQQATGINYKRIIGLLLSMMLAGTIIIEFMEFIVIRNNLEPGLVDITIIVLIFNITGILLFQLSRGQRRRMILMQVLNLLVAILVLVNYIVNPLVFNPRSLRVLDISYSDNLGKESEMLLILPFSSFIGPDKAYIAEGIHAGLINEVGTLNAIPVIGETTARSYKDAGKTLPQIAAELHAKFVIEADLHQLDNTYELNIRLIDPFPEERVIWTQTYQRRMEELPTLYKDITLSIADHMDKMVSPNDRRQLSSPVIVNADAYEDMLLASQLMGHLTPDALKQAEKLLLSSIERDSTYAPALGLLSLLWASKKQMGWVSPEDANPYVKKFQKKAIQMDSTNAEAWGGLAASLVWTDYDPEAGAAAFERSIELNPNLAPSRAAYAHTLMILGRWEEAWEQMKVAEELDPINPWTLAFSGAMYGNEGKLLSASKKFETLVTLVPSHPMANMWLLNKYARTFQYKKAIVELKKFIGPDHLQLLENQIDAAFETEGFKAVIQVTVEGIEKNRHKYYFLPSHLQGLYALIGDKENRIKLTQIAYEENDPNLPYAAIRNDDPIQDDPRYIAIMEEAGFW